MAALLVSQALGDAHASITHAVDERAQGFLLAVAHVEHRLREHPPCPHENEGNGIHGDNLLGLEGYEQTVPVGLSVTHVQQVDGMPEEQGYEA